MTKSNIQVHGHRGCCGLLSENSIPAFQKAIDLGVTAIELDIVVSSDHQLIVTHDPWINPLLSKPLGDEVIIPESHNIYTLREVDIKQYCLGELPHPEFPEQRLMRTFIPTLQDVVNTLGVSNDWYYNIEVKSEPRWYGQFQPDAGNYAQLLIDFIRKNRLEKHCMVQCFDPDFLEAFYVLEKNIALGLLSKHVTDHIRFLESLSFVPQYYNPDYTSVSIELIESLHERGVLIVPWTVNDKKVMERLIEMGVDGIITDYPNLLLS